jgi:hypothetical protein
MPFDPPSSPPPTEGQTYTYQGRKWKFQSGVWRNVAVLSEVDYVASNPTGITGADVITNAVSLTQAEYDAIVSPDASTLYVITD